MDDCPLVAWSDEETSSEEADAAMQQWTTRVIVLTQACDLEQAKTRRVLVAAVRDAQNLVDQGILKGAVIRDHMRRHLVFGWYFLPEARTPTSMPESIVDLRDVHSVPRQILHRLIAAGKRVASLPSPYREHLAQHFAVTYMRVALPEPFGTKP